MLERPRGDPPAARVEEAVLAGDRPLRPAPRALQVLVEEGALVALGDLPGQAGVAGRRREGAARVLPVQAVKGGLVVALADVVVGVVDARPGPAQDRPRHPGEHRGEFWRKVIVGETPTMGLAQASRQQGWQGAGQAVPPTSRFAVSTLEPTASVHTNDPKCNQNTFFGSYFLSVL